MECPTRERKAARRLGPGVERSIISAEGGRTLAGATGQTATALEERDGVRSLGRVDLGLAGAIGLSAYLVLLVLAQIYPVHDFYVTGNAVMSNDQVGYITTARWLAETGELRSHLIYPSHLREPRYRLYMPGTYYVLAVGHILFGPGDVAWRIPAMLSFVLAAVGVFLIGRRFYGRVEGVVAAGLFMLFPPMGAFAFTAMPQLPFIAAGVSAFCIFAYLPARLRGFLVPVLLVGPFLFRETGALLIIPMLLVLHGELRRRRGMTVMAVSLSSILVLYGLLEWQKASGRGSLSPVAFGSFNYANAFPPAPAPLTIGRLWMDLTGNVSSSIDGLWLHLRHRDEVALFLGLILAFAFLATLRGARRDSRRAVDTLALGAGLLAFAAALMISTLYTWSLYRGLRAVLFTFPLLAVCVAPGLVSGLRRLQRGLPRPVSLLSALGAIGLLIGGAWHGARRLVPQFDGAAGRRAVAVLEGLDLRQGGVLVAPSDFALDYVLRHYPLRWSFVPRNSRTLRLLARKYHVQTIIVATNTRQGNSSRFLETIRDLGLVRVREGPHPANPKMKLLVFERPRG
jgi:4-amino-4-deoxy-L-arabinose transferase-like glycosyltransferase